MFKHCLLVFVVAFVCAAPQAQVPVPGTPVTAVEYFHAGFGHYFVTAQPDEIAGLDAGVIAGWTRTGQRFGVWTSGTGLADVCRFFTTFFAPRSSHFYTANAAECEDVKHNPVWQYEKLAFKVALPDGAGNCPVGVPLYRLYNNGQTGAPNHRYTTSLAIRAQMLAAGFLAEDDNTACIASAIGPLRTTAEGVWVGGTSTGRSIVIVVLDDGTFAAVYTVAGSTIAPAGVIQGASKSSGGTFDSIDARDYGFVTHLVGGGVVAAGYEPMGTMSGVMETTAGNESFSAGYNPAYDQPASLAEAAGAYGGLVMTTSGLDLATLTVSATGAISGAGSSGCAFTGVASPRGSVNLFDVTITFGGGACLLGAATLVGVGYYEPSLKEFVVVAPTANRADLVLVGGTKP